MRTLSFQIGLTGFLALSMVVPSVGNVLAQTATNLPIQMDFEGMEIGSLPPGFSAAVTGEGGPTLWVVEAADPADPGNARVLAQLSSERVSYRFPVCVYEPFVAADVELLVRFKPISGEIDQAAGLVWRYQDVNNYYVVRANALEDNVVLYKMEDGQRSDLRPVGAWFFSYGADAEVPANNWSTLSVVVRGNRFSVSLNGDHLFDVEDDTFSESGKVGLWTKADSVTQFDDFTILSLDQG